jgi:hypothetical protein
MTLLRFIPLCLAMSFSLFGCAPNMVEEIAEGVTEGIIDQIEEYVQEKNHKK